MKELVVMLVGPSPPIKSQSGTTPPLEGGEKKKLNSLTDKQKIPLVIIAKIPYGPN